MKLTKVENTIDNMLTKYTRGEYYETLMQAKKEYVALTGRLTEEDEEYESRMYCFNNWYLFQRRDAEGSSMSTDYLHNHPELEEKVQDVIKNINHSVFEFLKVNLKKEIVLYDILHDKKITLGAEQTSINLIVGDIFTGRSVVYDGTHFLLRGVCLLPTGIVSGLKKKCKALRKLNNPKDEIAFLLQLESLKTKYLRYSHIDPNEIFIFT
ncbi:MAG: hypothetical protein JNM93_00595 [Bacteriovoracaceae bacterium]|nr:hypothetical protein [Bacteriovoracaceae bacterium]